MAYRLSGNPFRHNVVVRTMAGNPIKSLTVYDAKGRMVYSRHQASGVRGQMSTTQVWDGVDNDGRKASNGNYYMQVNTAHGMAKPRVTLLR